MTYLCSQWARHYVRMSGILFIFYICHFSLNRTDVPAEQRCVTQNRKWDGVRKCWHCWKETCPGNNISNCPEICTVPCNWNLNSIVDVKVWIMGGVVLQGLVMLMPSKAKKQYLCALNVYDDRVRKDCGIRGHNPPFLSFFEFLFSLSLSKHPVKWQVNRKLWSISQSWRIW